MLRTSLVALILYELAINRNTVHADAADEQTTAAKIEFTEDPDSKTAFPSSIPTATDEPALLIGLGVRKISFLKVKVYVVGLYMTKTDVGKIGWKKFDPVSFMTDDRFAEHMLGEPVEISLRIEPVRSTNGSHLRDGFTRTLLQRMKDQSDDLSENDERDILRAIQEFKANFPKTTVKPGSAFIFTKTVDGSLRMEYEGEQLGIVPNRWLCRNFFMSYLNAKTPISESAKRRIADGFAQMIARS